MAVIIHEVNRFAADKHLRKPAAVNAGLRIVRSEYTEFV